MIIYQQCRRSIFARWTPEAIKASARLSRTTELSDIYQLGMSVRWAFSSWFPADGIRNCSSNVFHVYTATGAKWWLLLTLMFLVVALQSYFLPSQRQIYIIVLPVRWTDGTVWTELVCNWYHLGSSRWPFFFFFYKVLAIYPLRGSCRTTCLIP